MKMENTNKVAELIAALKSENKSVRQNAAWELGTNPSEEAIPALEEALNDKDRYVRQSAKRVLENIRKGKSGKKSPISLDFITSRSARESNTMSTGTRNTKMMITGAVLVIVAIVALVARDSIVDPMEKKATETYMLRSMRSGERMANKAEIIGNIITYGGYGIGAIGLVLLAVGLIGYVQQTSSSATGQGLAGTQPQRETPSDPERSEETPASAGSIPEQIEQLVKLKEQGILTDAEFEEKKKDLLSRL